LHQLRTAEAEAAERLVGLIEERAKEHWQAAAWMLERRHPDLFGKNAAPDQPLGGFEVLMDDE
jgi:hypothetical protein